MTAPDHTTPRKRCNKCGNLFPMTSEFWHSNKREKDGLCRTCKACAIARARQWNADNKARASQRAKQYYAEHSEQIKQRVTGYAREHAEQVKAYHAEYHQRNKAEQNAKMREHRRNNRAANDKRVREWVAAHPDRRKEIANRYGKTPKGTAARTRRRARERGLPYTFTAQEWQMCLRYWHHRCAYCGEHKPLSADHFIPLVSPDCPGTVARNMLPACKSCNSSKQHRDPVEWLTERTSDYIEILGQIAAYFDIL